MMSRVFVQTLIKSAVSFYKDHSEWQDLASKIIKKGNQLKAKLMSIFLWVLPIGIICLILWVVFYTYSESQHLASKITEEGDLYSVQLKAQQEIFKTTAQLFGGLALLVGLFFTGRNTRIAQRNMKIAEDGKITDRFSKAVEQLGSDKLEIRLGGIYALERIAMDSEKDHQQVMEVLTAFVRDNSSQRKNEIHEPASQIILPVGNWHSLALKEKLDTDIQAILTVIGRRESAHVKKEKRGLDLSRTHLSKAFFSEANLERADLSEAHLEGAQLRRAHLEGAKILITHLEGADLWRAHLEGADLWRAHLEGANLQEANLEGADFEGTHLNGAKLERANLLKANNLTIDQLSTVKTLYNVVGLDSTLLKQVQEKYPNLLKMRERRKKNR